MISALVDSLVFLFVVIDPFAVMAMFVLLTQYDTKSSKRRIARKACLISLTILLLFAFLGEGLLDMLRISTPALQISGGILLLLVAIEMVIAGHSSSTTKEDQQEVETHRDISVFPLAIPLIAGPGSLTSVVIQMRKAGDDLLLQGGIIFILVLVVGIIYCLLSFATRLARIFGETGTNIMTRVLGIILAALSCQFLINGVVAGLIKPFLGSS